MTKHLDIFDYHKLLFDSKLSRDIQLCSFNLPAHLYAILFVIKPTMAKSSKLQSEQAHIFKANKKVAELNKEHISSASEMPPVPYRHPYERQGQLSRLDFIKDQLSTELPYLSGNKTFNEHDQLAGNIENFIGMARIPVGLAGPIVINGTAASGAFYVPMATTEGALLASFSRGMKACRESGSITSVCLIESVQRSPVFRFKTVIQSGEFAIWVLSQTTEFEEIVKKSTRFGRLKDVAVNMEGNNINLVLEFSTGDAAGQNMVTLATENLCQYILSNTPVKPAQWFVESNYSGDKKATAMSFGNVRGKKVTAEIILTKEIVADVLKSTPQRMTDYWRTSTLSVIQSGAIGAQGHFANGLTALFMACGQDVACVAEAAVGITRMELTEAGDLYASVTLPALIVGTVGGGTHLPTQRECLELMGCYGAGNSRKFAEICGAVVLAGELSIAAALASGQFTQAHAALGRKNHKS